VDALRTYDRTDIRRRSTGGNVNGATREGSHKLAAIPGERDAAARG